MATAPARGREMCTPTMRAIQQLLSRCAAYQQMLCCYAGCYGWHGLLPWACMCVAVVLCCWHLGSFANALYVCGGECSSVYMSNIKHTTQPCA